MLASLLLFILFPILCISKKARPNEGYFSTVGGSYVFALSWFIDGMLSIVRGATQIATTPLTWFIKMPVRAIITVFTDKKDLLIENKPSIQALVTEAKKAHEGSLLLQNEVKCIELTREIHRKYKKEILAGGNSELNLMRTEERALYQNASNALTLSRSDSAHHRSVYFALFEPKKAPVISENAQQASENLVANK